MAYDSHEMSSLFSLRNKKNNNFLMLSATNFAWLSKG